MSSSIVSIAGLVRRATLLVFLCALIVGSATFYFFFSAASMRHIEDEARTLLNLAMATRDYTIQEIRPLLDPLPDDTFRPEEVPSFAAQSVFRRLVGDGSTYAYREAATNPTNPQDQATAFEEGLIAEFQADGTLTESKGIQRLDGSPIFYLARPIEVDDAACLACHSTPAAAPAAMVAAYGDQNGFGWRMGDIIGVQLLTVPVADELRSIYELVAIFFGLLVVLFVVVSLMVTVPLQRNVIQPLRQLTAAAERSSLRNDSAPMPEGGAGEIQKLSQAIARLRTSLSLSIGQSDKPK